MRFLLAAIAALYFTACSKPAPNQLTVGMELEYPPFETVDNQGNPTGVSVDLAKALGEHLGRKVVIRDFKFKGLPAALSSGKIDLVISSMTATEERAKAIDFSDPYAQIGLALLVQKGSTLTDTQSLNHPDITIAVKAGTTGEIFADSQLPAARLLRLEQAGTCALDAFIYDQSSILEFAERQPDTTQPLPAPLQAENWAIGIRKGNDELRNQVNEFLKNYRAEGGFDRLADKHLKKQKERFKEAGVPFIF